MHACACVLVRTFENVCAIIDAHCRRAWFKEKTKRMRNTSFKVTLYTLRNVCAFRVPRNRDGTGNELSIDYTSGQSRILAR